MDILQEFLETSTIHGLTYISTAKVGATFFSFYTFPIDLVGKDPVVWGCHTWVYRGWIPNRPVLQRMAGVSNCHLNHNTSH